MVSEGVDIPRLRVGVYATAAKTPLIFRQIVGRFVRTIPGRPVDMSWLYLPADPVLRGHAADVERELRHVLTPPRDDDRSALDEPRRARETERGEEPAFVPVAADVAPQLALFGAPGPGPGRMAPAVPASAPPATPTTSRPRCPHSSAARCCATSAIAWSPTCAVATAAATPRSTAG